MNYKLIDFAVHGDSNRHKEDFVWNFVDYLNLVKKVMSEENL